jgi:hypothetical protein
VVRKVLDSKLAIHVLALSRQAVERLAATNSGIMADHFPADPLEPPVRWHAPVIVDDGVMASAQHPASASTTCGSVKPAAVSISGNPLFDCPE